MKPTHPRTKNEAKVNAKSIKEIVEPAQTVGSEASVEAALEKMRARGNESSAVTDQGGKLLGSVSKNQMNRKVGGWGHDPHTVPVEPQVDKEVACCSEDQTIGEAEKVMIAAKVDEVPVVTQDKLVVGKVTLGAIAQKKHAATRRRPRAMARPLKRGKRRRRSAFVRQLPDYGATESGSQRSDVRCRRSEVGSRSFTEGNEGNEGYGNWEVRSKRPTSNVQRPTEENARSEEHAPNALDGQRKSTVNGDQ